MMMYPRWLLPLISLVLALTAATLGVYGILAMFGVVSL